MEYHYTLYMRFTIIPFLILYRPMVEKNSQSIRKELYTRLINLLFNAHSGHIGSCLSCLDIVIQTVLFELTPEDIFIISKGHAAPAYYVVLNYLGKISDNELATFHNDGTKLPAHTPNYHFQDVFHFPTGSLGHGLSLSCGIVHAMKIKSSTITALPWVYTLISDGECNEGQVWEAVQYASQKKLSHLIVLIDKNKIQAFGRTKDVLGDSASVEKWSAFGFEVITCDGHNLRDISRAIHTVKNSQLDKPKVIICDTVKGNGVSFMEDTIEWHYNVLDESQYKIALEDIEERIL